MASQQSIAMVFFFLMVVVGSVRTQDDQDWTLSPDDQSKANSWIIQPVKRPNIPIPPGGMLLMTMDPNATMTDNMQPILPPPVQSSTQEPQVEVSSSSDPSEFITSQSPADATESISFVTSQSPIENVQTTEDIVTEALIPDEISSSTDALQLSTQFFEVTTQFFEQFTDSADQTNDLTTVVAPLEEANTPEPDEQLPTASVTDDSSWLQNVVTDGVFGEISATTETDAEVTAVVDGVTTLVSTDSFDSATEVAAPGTELPEIVTENFLPITTDAAPIEDSDSSDGSGSPIEDAPVAPAVPEVNPETLAAIDIELSQDENELARKKPSRHLLSSDDEEQNVEKQVEEGASNDAAADEGKLEEEARQYQRRRPYPIRPGDIKPRPSLNRQGYQQNLRPDYDSYSDYNIISRTYDVCYGLWCKIKGQLKNIGLL